MLMAAVAQFQPLHDNLRALETEDGALALPGQHDRPRPIKLHRALDPRGATVYAGRRRERSAVGRRIDQRLQRSRGCRLRRLWERRCQRAKQRETGGVHEIYLCEISVAHATAPPGSARLTTQQQPKP